jgi:hypothetical protein
MAVFSKRTIVFFFTLRIKLHATILILTLTSLAWTSLSSASDVGASVTVLMLASDARGVGLESESSLSLSWVRLNGVDLLDQFRSEFSAKTFCKIIFKKSPSRNFAK